MSVETEVFRSLRYPDGQPWALILAREGVRPLAILMLPLMVTTLVVALSAGNLLPLIMWGYPIALVTAGAWTAFTLERHVAEIQVEESGVRIRSIADCALGRMTRMKPLFDVRDYRGWLVVAAGDSDFVIEMELWPEYERLRISLRRHIYPSASVQ